MNKQINYNNTHIDEVNRTKISVSIVSTYQVTHGVGRHIKGVCTTCGQVHDEWLRIEGMTGYADIGHACYIGYDSNNEDKCCALPKRYHASNNENIITNTNKVGVNNTTRHRKPEISIELEIYSSMYGRDRYATMKALGLVEGCLQDKAFTRVYLRLLHIGKKASGRTNSIEEDCTVTAEGHAWFRNLKSLQKFLAGCTIEELKCFFNDNCGAHMHVGSIYAKRRWCGRKVFEEVFKFIQSLSDEERITLFGSTFRGYASETIGGHGCCINYQTGYNTIEFRLPRIYNTEQYIRVCKWFRALIACIDENGALVDEGIMSPERLGKKLGRIDIRWNMFSKGR